MEFCFAGLGTNETVDSVNSRYWMALRCTRAVDRT